MRERGFIQLSPTLWLAIGVGVLVAGLGIALKVQTARLDSCKADHAAFVAMVKAEGVAAEKAARKKEAEDVALKEKTDAAHKAAVAALNADVARLRNQRPVSRIVPSAPADSRDPSLACFDRAELAAAIGRFVTDARGIADEGAAEALALQSAREWAAKLR